ncbi:hypothetical protein T10_8893 [Trichinella papuae]|uniref:SEFIR domain-containing protein n=1 Tax=Trichinella papuae TaxID=268474 RepID=A0A0V1N8K1_9BILA|nr:hypothetical protein T10_8893 [Trichinella papuae]
MRIIVAVVCIFWSVCICYSGREILSGCTNQDRLGCLTSSKCDFESEGEVDYQSISPPHDLRIVCHIMVNSEGELPVYQLVTNITWRPPFDETLERVRGFGLTIIDEDTGDVHCYTMRVDNSKWTKADQSASIVMWLFLDNLFAFGSRYRVDVETLPKSSSNWLLKVASTTTTTTATQLVTMPERPDSGNMLPPAGGKCSPQARLNAYRWVTAFRLVHIKPWHRSIDVQFIAAPPAFCFDAYELRLIQSKRDIVQSGLFQVDKLYKEHFDNATIYYGNYTFYNVQPGEYSIGIIPIDKDKNGTCLCPAPGEHCSCSLSILPDFVVQEAAFPTVDPCEMISSTAAECNHKLNGTKQFVIPHVSFSDYFTTNVMLLSVCVAVGMICLLFGVLYIRQRWMKAFKGNLQRYISTNLETTISLLPLATSKVATITTTTKQTVEEENFRNKAVKLGEQHLDSVSDCPVYCILLLYAPDSAAHEQCVRSLASWLQQACSNISLRVDFLCRAEVARSKIDWAQRSVQQADLIVLVQSTGAFMRYQAKVLDDPDIGIVQRKQPSEFDDLFLIQVDLLLNALLYGREFGANERRGRGHRHRRLINLRFSYTGNEWTLPPFASHTCYELPNHFQFFLHTLTDHGIQVLHGSIEPLRKAILDASEFISVNRDWFLSLHCRRLTTNNQTVDNDNNNTRWSIGNSSGSSSCKHLVEEEDDAALEQPHQNFAMHDDADDDDELKKQFTLFQRKQFESKLEKNDQFKQIIRQLVIVEHACCSDVGVAAGAGTTTLERCLEEEKQNNPTVSIDDGFGDDSGEQRSSSSSSSISHLRHLTSSRYSPPPHPAVAVP